MIKLFVANLKLLVRNRQSLFWSIMFPLIFTVIFGFFFGKGSINAGAVALVNQSNSQLATTIEKDMTASDLFKIQKVSDLPSARDLMKQNKVNIIVDLPANFGSMTPDDPKKINVILDPANNTSNSVVTGFLNQYLTATNFQIQKAQPIYQVATENTTSGALSYFDFVLIGLLGMALMNSSIQGLSISMARYKEDKILKRITTTPLPGWKFISAEVASRLILNFVQISLILLVGVYGFKAHVPTNLGIVFLISLFGAVLFQLIGFVIAAITKTTDAAEGAATAIAIPMMFLAGVFFPIDQLPKWLYSLVQYLPLAPLLRMLRGVALNYPTPYTTKDILIVASWIVVMLFIAIYRFRLSEE